MHSERILLRALEPSDIDFILQLENDTENWHVSNTLVPFSRYAIEQYVLNAENDLFSQKQLRLIIESKDESKSVGAIDLFDFDPLHKRAGVGIIIIKQEQHKGFASEALELLTKHCFSVLGLHQLYCNISTDNEQSIALFQKCGFISCCMKKEWTFRNGQWIDELMLQLINK
jgi:diamine N-acetyltransferase